MKIFAKLAVIFLGFSLVACGSNGAFNPDPLPKIPLGWVEDLAPSGWVLFQDDFSDPGSGWEISSDPDGIREYRDGIYRFSIGRPDWYYWATPNLEFSDIHIDSQVTRLSGDGVSAQGLICRLVDEHNFYAFTITNDGYYGISKVQEGVEQLLGAGTLLPSPDILRGNQMNFIGIDCIDDRLSLWINGTMAISLKDSSFGHGEVGMIATILSGDSAVIDFDNFSVLKP